MSSLAFYEEIYGGDHPYGYAIGGYHDTIRDISRERLVDFHKQHYGPGGMFLVIVGSVDAEEALTLVDKHFGDWKDSGQSHRVLVPQAQPPQQAKLRKVPISGKTQSDIVLGFLGPCRHDPDFQAVSLANSILGVFGMYGRLGKNVRNKLGLAYYSFSRVDGSLGPGTWRMIAGVNPTNVEAAKEAMLHEARLLISKKVRHSELEDNKSYILGSLPLQLETNEGVAHSIANIEMYDLGLDYLQLLPDQILGITSEQILAAASKHITPEQFVMAVSGP
jgi:zinc protease